MEIKEVLKGGFHTVLNVQLEKGECLDEHYATSDAVVVILEGKAKVIFDDKQVSLEKESAYLIPGLKYHTLEASEHLRAYIILGSRGNIQMTKDKY